MTTRQKYERQGYEFYWAGSAYMVCIRHQSSGGREWLGTFNSRRAYAIPADGHEAIAEHRAASGN